MLTRRTIHVSLLLLALLLAALMPGSAGAAKPTPPPVTVTLTSLTIDPEDATGTTTNAPGAWSTNLADPLCQAGVSSRGDLLNGTEPGIDLGEIAIPLRAGTNSLNLRGDGIFPENAYYGAVLFFDGRQVGPQIAVYNANGSTPSFLVQPAGTEIMGGAHGGWFFDYAPGTAIYTAPDGTTVEVLAFTIDALTGSGDRVSCYQVGANGTPDMMANLVLKVTPPKVR